LSAGAFSDDKVVAAAAKIECVLVDCNWGQAHKDLSDKYKIRGYPTVVFTDSDGKQIELMTDRTAAALVKQITTIADKHTKGVTYLPSWEKASEAAKKEQKLVLYFFVGSDKDESAALKAAIEDDSLEKLRESFVLVRMKVDPDAADCKRFEILDGTSPLLLILDPAAEKPEEKPLMRVTGKRDAEQLKQMIETVLEARK